MFAFSYSGPAAAGGGGISGLHVQYHLWRGYSNIPFTDLIFSGKPIRKTIVLRSRIFRYRWVSIVA